MYVPEGAIVRRCIGLLVCSVFVASCSKSPVRPASLASSGLDPPIFAHGLADDSPAWSQDGQQIAYHRGFPSADGPAGVYVISRWGGRPRLVTAGDFDGPRYLRFSPDGRRLAASWRNQLCLIDIATGAVNSPMYTAAGAVFPDWSPDGLTLLYRRVFYLPGYSPDSGGLHLFDLRTNVDRPLRFAIGDSPGRPRWSDDGLSIAYEGFDGPTDVVALASPSDSSVAALARAPAGLLFENIQWYASPATGIRGVLFQEVGRQPEHTRLVAPDGRALPWRYLLGPWDAVSPDGRELVLVRSQPGDSIGVLFIREVDDVTGNTRRQLTAWVPLHAPRPNPALPSAQASR